MQGTRLWANRRRLKSLAACRSDLVKKFLHLAFGGRESGETHALCGGAAQQLGREGAVGYAGVELRWALYCSTASPCITTNTLH